MKKARPVKAGSHNLHDNLVISLCNKVNTHLVDFCRPSHIPYFLPIFLVKHVIMQFVA